MFYRSPPELAVLGQTITGLVLDNGQDEFIIDDGGHQNQQVVTSFECLWPYVKSGGFYAVENLPIARGTGLVSSGWPEHMDWVKDKMPFDFDSQFDALHFFRELVIFRKK